MLLSRHILNAIFVEFDDDERAQMISRYEKHAPMFVEQLRHIYGCLPEFNDWCSNLMLGFMELAAQRPTTLRELDRRRTVDKNWFVQQDMIGYCTYVDRFAGDLQGVMKKIPHLVDMGVRYLHLLPFLKAREGDNDGGFAVSSYDDVEPALGTIDDLVSLTAQLRAANISLCSDFVLNHVADDHAWAIAAQQGDEKYKSYFYTYPDRHTPDIFEKTVGEIFPQAAPGNFTFVKTLDAWVWTTFYPYQWDLNYTNPAIFYEMSLALLRLANRGVEVFRLDSTAFLWKREGTNCMNQAEAHWILQAMRSMIEIVAPAVLLKAEAIVPTADLPAYIGGTCASKNEQMHFSDGGNKTNSTVPIQECHIAYHSSLMAASWVALAQQDATMIYRVMTRTPALPAQTSWLTYVRCHDDIGWNVLRAEAGEDGALARETLSKIAQFYAGEANSYARGASFQAADANAVHGTVGMTASLCGMSSAKSYQERRAAQQRILLLYGLALCFGGLPVIYMGDEIGQGNFDDYALNPAAKNDSRWLQRPFLDAVGFQQRNDERFLAGDFFHSLRHLLARRRETSQIAASMPRYIIPSQKKELLIFGRGNERSESQFVFVGNFSEYKMRLDLRELDHHQNLPHSWRDVLTETTFRADSTHLISLEPHEQLWLSQI